MKLMEPLLFLPLMHRDLAHLPTTLFADPQVSEFVACMPVRSLWPGLPISSTTQASHAQIPTKAIWQPATYPFTAQEATAILRDIAHMGDMALSGVPMEALVMQRPVHEAVRDVQEQEALQKFVANPSVSATTVSYSQEHVLRAAQKFLLMAWYLEERFLEIRALTQAYDSGTINLQQTLGEDCYAEVGDTTLRHVAQLESQLQDIQVSLPNWQKVVENAALFLPETCTVFVNDVGMADHIREHFPLQQMDADVLVQAYDIDMDISTDAMVHIRSYATFSACSMSVGELLAKPISSSGPLSLPWLQKHLHCILMENV